MYHIGLPPWKGRDEEEGIRCEYRSYIYVWTRLRSPSIFFAGREGMIPGGEVRRPFAPFGAEAPIFIDIPVYLCYYLV